MLEQTKVKTLDKVAVRFTGDSGDGMQLAGNLFSNVSAAIGNEISTFPDYPVFRYILVKVYILRVTKLMFWSR